MIKIRHVVSYRIIMVIIFFIVHANEIVEGINLSMKLNTMMTIIKTGNIDLRDDLHNFKGVGLSIYKNFFLTKLIYQSEIH